MGSFFVRTFVINAFIGDACTHADSTYGGAARTHRNCSVALFGRILQHEIFANIVRAYFMIKALRASSRITYRLPVHQII
ncbi:hypothetical protein WT12_21975 [Burkholderia territorii]|nr:hypothetical protein WT00_04695 [Burkholderia territorii]KVN44752.1 hypothetical protein WT12_21975 [Burkholderia territorii]